ncbi:MAG TPA: GWxTD domain-containing protein [Flavobacteriales bacterium]
MKRTLTLPLAFAILIALLTACGGAQPVTVGDNYAYLYGKRSGGLRLQARVYHADAQRSVIYFKLNTADLLYKSSGGGPFRAQVLLKYSSYASWDEHVLLDSASTLVKDQSAVSNEDKELIGSLEMRGNTRQQFLIMLSARDLNRDVESTVMITVDRTPGSRQTFLPMDGMGLPLFDDHVAPGTPMRVMHEEAPNSTLVAQHFATAAKLPMPVFAESSSPVRSAPDSTWTVVVGPDGWFPYTAARSGFTHFLADTTRNQGFTVFSSGESYPDVATVDAMVPPLRYITSSQEWERITKSSDPRKEVERFWLDAAGDRERAREAIKAYYTRVEGANRYFTGEQEGWRTDRGLVHIIFGMPSTIRRSEKVETWIYGEETNLMSLVFTFTRKEDPYSGNDMVLRRDAQFKSAWYRNVESWRNGRVMQN